MTKNCKVRGLERGRVSGEQNALQVGNGNGSAGVLGFFLDRPGLGMQQDSNASVNVCLRNS